MNARSRLQPALLSVLRIVTAYLYIWHGTARFLGFPVSTGEDSVTLLSLYGMAGILEIVGGTLLLTGLLTRPVALLLGCLTAAGHLLTYTSNLLPPQSSITENAALFCSVFLYLLLSSVCPIPLTRPRNADAV